MMDWLLFCFHFIAASILLCLLQNDIKQLPIVECVAIAEHKRDQERLRGERQHEDENDDGSK